MENVGTENVLYCDTDSVVFVHPEDDNPLITGRFLGDLTSELDDGETIVEFVATGPKSYAYKTSNEKYCVKSKGISQTSAVCGLLNYETMRHMVVEAPETIITVPNLVFKLTPTYEVQTQEGASKDFKYGTPDSKKRWISSVKPYEIDTLPWTL
jgi:hypothetical protein